MTEETYNALYGDTKIDTDTTVSLAEVPTQADDKYILYLRVNNRIIDEHYVMFNVDGEVNTSDLNQAKRDFALISMTVGEVRNMVYRYIAEQLTETFSDHSVNSATVKRVNDQVKKFMRYYRTEILPKRASLYEKKL